MSDNKKNVDLNKVSYNFGTKGWTVIGFEIDNGGVMGRAEKACDYTEYYHSIIGSGPVSVVKDREEKKKILTIFMECQDKKHFEFTDRMAAHVAVYKIEADEFACKEHNM